MTSAQSVEILNTTIDNAGEGAIYAYGSKIKTCVAGVCHRGHRCNSFNGSLWCKPCMKGAVGDGLICTLCAPGRTSNAGNTACEPCPVGTFAHAGAAVCAKCTAGRASNATKAKDCAACKVGAYAKPGATACATCAAGTSDNDADATTPCAICSAGKAPAPSRVGCLRCQGASVSFSGTACVTCNNTQPNADHTACVPCAANEYFDSAKAVCRECPTNTEPDTSEGGSGCICIKGLCVLPSLYIHEVLL